MFFQIRSQLRHFSIEKLLLIVQKFLLDNKIFPVLNVVNFRSHEIYRKFDKIEKMLKIGNVRSVFYFEVIFGSFWCLWGQPKKSKISTNTYRMMLILHELNSMGEII